jgi:hypothetical protein
MLDGALTSWVCLECLSLACINVLTAKSSYKWTFILKILRNNNIFNKYLLMVFLRLKFLK